MRTTSARLRGGMAAALGALAACGAKSGLMSEPAAQAPIPPHRARLAAGASHVCYATPAGELWCWGYNRDGWLFGEATDPISQPAPRRIAIP